MDSSGGSRIPAMPASTSSGASPSTSEILGRLATSSRAREGSKSAQVPPNFTACGNARSNAARVVFTTYLEASGSTKSSMALGISSPGSTPRYCLQALELAFSLAPWTRERPCMRHTRCETSSISLLPMKKGLAPADGCAPPRGGRCTAVSRIPWPWPGNTRLVLPSVPSPLNPSTAAPSIEPSVPSTLSSAAVMSETEASS
mmetsp:Transcript_94378/g.170462  ORF Transcript_94378/g.170462 Transcript_94378/m.170462 type:complete len:202 (+) Transcript_94378:807-1412(+)